MKIFSGMQAIFELKNVWPYEIKTLCSDQILRQTEEISTQFFFCLAQNSITARNRNAMQLRAHHTVSTATTVTKF